MSNFEKQLKQIREEKRLAYIKYVEQTDNNKEQISKKAKENEYNHKKSQCMNGLVDKYKYLLNPSPKIKAAKKIQRFIRKNWFEPKCINNNEIHLIPPLYRIRIYITNQHINEYSEEGIDRSMLQTYRRIYIMNLENPERFILFRYCFDIRNLYFRRNQIIELYDNFYFMQPDDHARIESCWRKVNGGTNESIIYLNNFEFAKSLAIDINRSEISQAVRYIDIDEIDIEINDDFLDNINRKYLDNGN